VMSWSAERHAECRMCTLGVVERHEWREAKRVHACSSRLPPFTEFAGHYQATILPLQLDSALLSSDLTAAITNHPNRFTFGGVIAECIKTVFARRVFTI